MKVLNLKVKKLHPKAIIPTRAHNEDAGLDLYALEKVQINSHQEKLIRTGLALAIPSGWYGSIEDRGSTPVKMKLTKAAGIIDSNYRDELQIVMINYTNAPKTIEAGQKIAQMVILPVPKVEIELVNELDETERTGGFGSTGE